MFTTQQLFTSLKMDTLRRSITLMGVCAIISAFSSASGETKKVEEAAESISLEQVAFVPLPAELTKPTGVSWHKPSEQFIVTTESGQLATLDGNSLQVSAITESGLSELSDITSHENTIIATSNSGKLLTITVNEGLKPIAGTVKQTDIKTPVTGVAIHPQLKQVVLSTDSAKGPKLLLIDELGESNEVLRLNDNKLTSSASLMIFGASPIVSIASAPLFTSFTDKGTKELHFLAEGMSVITGLTTKDGTIIVSGLDNNNKPVLAAYNVKNDEEINSDPNAGPATLTSLLSKLNTIILPEGIVQPSGITYDAKSDMILINTDQAEFFALDRKLSTIRQSSDISGFVQGDIEDLQVINPGQVFVVSESGGYAPFTFDDTQWVAGTKVENDAIDFEVSAIAYLPESKQLAYIPNEGQGKTLVLTNTDGSGKEVIAINTNNIGIDNLDEYTVAGMTFFNGLFYILSEQYSTIFTMTLAGKVTAAYGLKDAKEPTGLMVFDNALWVVFDHEDSDPVPPVVRYPLL